MAYSLPFNEVDGFVASGAQMQANLNMLLGAVNQATSIFSGTSAGQAPLSPGGTGAFLRADGIWAIPPNGGSLNTSFTQPGAGAVTRTVQTKLSDIAGIMDFGAVGNNVANDSAADTAARAALRGIGGGVLLYPSATGYSIGGATREPGIAIFGANFPAYAGGEPAGPFRVLTTNPNGSGGKIAISAFITSGATNATPFSTLGLNDSVALSGVVFGGSDSTQPIVAGNLQARFASSGTVRWGLEIDMNNEAGNNASNYSHAYGSGLVVNTGSTYSPDTAIVIQRSVGEGSGPGFRRGMLMSGVREQGIVFVPMVAATFAGMTPPAPGNCSLLVSIMSNETTVTWVVNERGGMSWGSGSAAFDTTLQRLSTGGLLLGGTTGILQLTSLFVGANQVVGARITGTPAVATDLTSTINLSNFLRSSFLTHGSIG